MTVADELPDLSKTELTKGEQTRLAILETAVQRFGRDGFRATSVADIARDAGLSGTAAYAYFKNKEDLFLAAVDHDAAALIGLGLSTLTEAVDLDGWREALFLTLVEAVEHHPLAERLLAGLEPDVTGRVLDIPALQDLRLAVADRLSSEQASGRVRADIDPSVIADGVVTMLLSLLMSVVQIGTDVVGNHAPSVVAVFSAAIDAPVPAADRR